MLIILMRITIVIIILKSTILVKIKKIINWNNYINDIKNGNDYNVNRNYNNDDIFTNIDNNNDNNKIRNIFFFLSYSPILNNPE